MVSSHHHVHQEQVIRVENMAKAVADVPVAMCVAAAQNSVAVVEIVVLHTVTP